MALVDQVEQTARGGWPAVAAAAAATFTVVTSEMLPVGLLTPLGASLGVSEGTAGLALTVTGLSAAVAAPVLAPLFARHDRRRLLVLLMALVGLGNLVSAWASNFAVMTAARLLVGVGMGGVWALAAGIAVRLVPPRSVGAATSLVFSGIAVASVLGVPAGAYVGELLGWRWAFAAAGVLGLAVSAVLGAALPPLPPEEGRHRLAEPLADARVRVALVVVALLVTGHFAAYTYVRPVLEEVSGIRPALVGALLLAYGVAGVAGNFAAGFGAVRSARATLVALSALLAATVFLVPAFGDSTAAAAVLLVLWGLAYGGVSVSVQTWLLDAVPRSREAASALLVAVFNTAIALGALAGGRAADGLGTASVMYLAGGLAAAAAIVPATVRRARRSAD
ncbi:MFS transporter [Yinghuangia sp. YIM S09857]|uniref:MFS transporter n=1 Tax=Yinghuangia sp. YIM S09857 TaxID=3436929 RepID=UPI003F538F49